MSTYDFEIAIEAASLSLANGDASIYDPYRLMKNEVYNTFGLGSLIRIDEPRYVDESFGGITPVVKPTAFVNSRVASITEAGSPFLFVIQDKNLWVVLPSWMETKVNKITVNKIINLRTATNRYKRLNLHFGKYKTKADASIVASQIAKAIEDLADSIIGGDLSRQFGPYVTSLTVNYSIEAANEIKFVVVDKDYKMMDNNFFMARRRIEYRGDDYEIGAVEVGPGPGGSPLVTVTAWNEAVQRMKRDKKPESISGSSVYEYAFNVAEKFGLQLVAEKSNKTQTINKGNGNNSDESVWSVLQSAANQDEFVFYVMDGVMIYGSQKWLMWKFGTDKQEKFDPKTKRTNVKRYSRLYFDPGEDLPADAQKFKVSNWPSIRQSENDPLEGDGSIEVEKPNGCVLRPGNTVIIGPKPKMFKGGYLVTEVSFSEGTNEPVQVSFRTPEKPSKQKDTE